MSPALAETWIPPRIVEAPGREDVWNAVASWLGTPFPLAGGVSGIAALTEAPEPGRLALSVELAGRPPVLAVPASFPFAEMFGGDLGVEDLPLLPTGLREALTEGMGLALLGVVPESPDGPARIVGQGAWPDLAGAAPLRWFRITLHGREAEPSVVDLGATSHALAALFGDGPYGALPRRPAWPGLGARLTCTLHETLGRLDLPLADVRSLRPGAVFVLPETLDPEAARFRLDATVFEFRPAQDGWACSALRRAPPAGREGPAFPLPSAPKDDATMDTRPGPGSPLHLAGLPIAVDLDLGRITVPLSEVEGWQVGSLVPLDPIRPDEGVEVVLRANGRVLGTGDLVRLDERLGVRITRLALD